MVFRLPVARRGALLFGCERQEFSPAASDQADVTELELDPRTALVLVDLQKGITGRPAAHPAERVVSNAAKLAKAFRAAGLPVVLVNVDFSPDRKDVLAPRVDAPPPIGALPADFGQLVPELDVQPGDLRVTKRQWGAFYGTELDLQLRRRHVTGIVLGGISTSIGVESTARAAMERGYQIAFASDAMTDSKKVSHEHSVEHIFPRIGQVRTTEEILHALQRVPKAR
jgi:nicotinamidase-related amidase